MVDTEFENRGSFDSAFENVWGFYTSIKDWFAKRTQAWDLRTGFFDRTTGQQQKGREQGETTNHGNSPAFESRIPAQQVYRILHFPPDVRSKYANFLTYH